MRPMTQMMKSRIAWCIGIGGSLLFYTAIVLAESAPPFVLGPKVTADRKVRSVVGPSVRIDDKGQISLAWVEEEKETRTVLYSRIEKVGGPIGELVRVNGSSRGAL